MVEFSKIHPLLKGFRSQDPKNPFNLPPPKPLPQAVDPYGMRIVALIHYLTVGLEMMPLH